MRIEHKMGIPSAYREIVPGECFCYQGDFYLRCDNGSFSLTSGELCEGLTEATAVFLVDAKIVIE